MKTKDAGLLCHLKSIRQAKGYSQQQLAEMVKVKRQAIYDIESGKYMPNTGLALRLARQLGCRVEDIFCEESPLTPQPIVLPEDDRRQSNRVVAARVRGRLVGYGLSGKGSLNDGFRAADGLLCTGGDAVSLLCSEADLDRTVMLLGCDPAFAILAAHVSRQAPEIRLHWHFSSSTKALQGLAAGRAHLAGTHLHNRQAGEENVVLAHRLLGDVKAMVIGFSLMEEGLMVAPGNPHQIRSVTDLADGRVRLANREVGAALRSLLDDYLKHYDIDPRNVAGYETMVASHAEGAQAVAFGTADAALGLRAVAHFNGLDFVALESVRCDLVIPRDLIDHPALNIVLDVLQGQKLKRELSSLPGYETSLTGTVIAEA